MESDAPKDEPSPPPSPPDKPPPPRVVYEPVYVPVAPPGDFHFGKRDLAYLLVGSVLLGIVLPDLF